MKRGKSAGIPALAAAVIFAWSCAERAPQADYPVKPVAFTDVHLTDTFWAPRLETNRTVTIPHVFRQNEETNRVKNFEMAEEALDGGTGLKFCTSYPFDDSDLYKTIEAAAYAMAVKADPELDRYVDGLIAKIAAAQERDGYLYTVRTINGPPPVDWMGKERWSNLYMSHELYNLGHLYEAAVAHYQATGKKDLLKIAVKSADLVAKEFGPGKRMNPPGHEEIEIGLVKLYRATGKTKYLDLAKFFIDARGNAEGHKLYGEYSQDHKPFVEQDTAVGHAVRAGYLYAGAADVAALTGDQAYLAALDKIWADMAGTKIYITGGIGAAGGWEGYGPPYRLPNSSAYAETCANIATFLWNSRMFRLEEDAKYVDVMERILYNGVLSGISLSGDRFFYPNPLASFGQHERVAWFGCACCPPNVARILASVPGYVYAAGVDKVYVNLFAQGAAKIAAGGTNLEIVQTTEYPWKGDVRIEVRPEQEAVFALHVRIPGWALGKPVPTDLYSYLSEARPAAAAASAEAEPSSSEPAEGAIVKIGEPLVTTIEMPELRVNGDLVDLLPQKGFAVINRTWKAGDVVELSLPMPVRRVIANGAVEADIGRVAVERGPLVYCAEWSDNDGRVSNFVLPDGAALTAEMRPDLLKGVVVIKGRARAVSEKAGRVVEDDKPITLIPYYSWANRGRGEMEVWIAREPGKARIAREPGLSAKAVVTMSDGAKGARGVNDQYEPESSDDATGYMHWWPKKGTAEWVVYTFDDPVRVSETSVYWFDDTGGGSCRVPESWRMLYKTGDTWLPVKPSGDFGTAKDTWNTVKFAPVRTTALRLELQMQPEWSAGVHEWKVK